MSRYTFRGKQVLSALILAPMVLPPFVGAIGAQQFLSRYGSLNLLLMRLGLLDSHNPTNWLGEYRFWGVVVLESLHLYPVLYLNLLAALSNVDARLEEAAQNLGARGSRLFCNITLPLILPGYFAGAIIVFIWAFTDLGTPLIFGYREVVPVKIFDLASQAQTNPVGYALVVMVLVITAVIFALSRRFARGTTEMSGERGGPASRERPAGVGRATAIYALTIGITLVAIMPHMCVFLKSVAARWSFSVLPERYTLHYYELVFRHPVSLSSIRISLLLSLFSTAADLALGFLIAYCLMRKRIRGRALLDIMAMLPLALPGIVLGFGYLTSFAGVPLLDPRRNPFLLLVIAYGVRRLPFTVRAAVAGFQQTSPIYEEASSNLGARPLTTVRRITIPLIFPNLAAGGALAFALAMLEVSESLILAMRREHYPIANAIYTMVGRIDDGPFIASAMGMLGMALLLACFVLASRFLGRRFGDVFRL
ncbi:iron ABC transporter permease [Candidatus Sumerlaeota bacterium]|nr:iron ABC transporter permease [Candidatus Sumerlaeota bacterium]